MKIIKPNWWPLVNDWSRFKLSRVLTVLLIFCLMLVVSQVYWRANFPYTHDGVNHLARFANYAAAIREGQWPPRFAPYVLNGFGFPVFNYNYPWANIVAVPLVGLGLSVEIIFKLQVSLALLVGISSVYLVLRRNFSVSASWLGVSTYLSSGYLINLLFWRGNIGELWSYVLIPALWWSLSNLAHSKRRWWHRLSVAFLITALLLSHNLFGLAGAGLILVASWWLSSQVGWRWWWLTTWSTGLGLSLWFWVPAVWELPLVVLAQDALANQAAAHLLRPAQLLWRPWRFGFSTPGPIDSLNLGLGFWFWFIWSWSLVYLAKKREHFRRISWQIQAGLIFLITLAIWLTSNFSTWIWGNISLIQIWQFPWRLLFLVSLAIVFVAAEVYQRSPQWLQALIWILVLWQFSAFWRLKAVDRFHYEPDYYLRFSMTTLTRNENRPITFTKQTYDWQPQPQILLGQGEVQNVDYWLGSKRQYQIYAQSEITVLEPTVYFPGWQIRANGQVIEPTFPASAEGQLAYRLPAADQPYQIKTTFVKRTPARWVGEGLSLLSLLSLVLLAYYDYRRE